MQFKTCKIFKSLKKLPAKENLSKGNKVLCEQGGIQ